MSSDDEDDLFGDDSDDTADLIATSKKSTAAAAKLKTPKQQPPKKKIATKSNNSDGGLFDSDSDDDDDKSPAKKSTSKNEALSKRQRLEALAKRKKGPESDTMLKGTDTKRSANAPSGTKGTGGHDKDADGYDSEDSYNSATFERTEEDDNFIDTTGEDADAVNELYAEQHFGDERPDREYQKKSKGSKKRRSNDDEAIEDNGNLEPDNPIMAAVHRMKKIKREKKNPTEVEDEVKHFLNTMELAADEDDTAIAERRPATKKLSMLNDVCDMMKRRDIQRLLLDFHLLKVCKRWIQPLPNGTLGNITVRQRLLDAISNMTGETGISANDLKQSEFGKTVMTLYKHRSETAAMKRQLKELVEQWSRPIFHKSGNMRDLERVHSSRGSDGLAALSRHQQVYARQQEREKQQLSGINKQQDLNSLIESGKKGGPESGINRVRVPFSKGFAFSVRPESRATASPEKRSDTSRVSQDNRSKLSKRMVEKGRAVGKNQRSANVSVEGRVNKG
jgi:transcription factor SPN1